MGFRKPCLKCNQLTTEGSYCKGCRPVRIESPERKAKKAALYNSDYRRQAKLIKQTATHCHICGKLFAWGDAIEADHIFPSQVDGPLAPAHRACNRRKGNTTT
jgi:5-methylcytosine-specific restriction endonuclease McrA